MSRRLPIHIEPVVRSLDRFEAIWNLAADDGLSPRGAALSFADLPLLLRTLTPARWDLLQKLRAAGPLSVYGLARLLERDYKNVHGEVKCLLRIGLLERGDDGRVAVGWDMIQSEFKL